MGKCDGWWIDGLCTSFFYGNLLISSVPFIVIVVIYAFFPSYCLNFHMSTLFMGHEWNLVEMTATFLSYYSFTSPYINLLSCFSPLPPSFPSFLCSVPPSRPSLISSSLFLIPSPHPVLSSLQLILFLFFIFLLLSPFISFLFCPLSSFLQQV